jgi:WD40 repeat protein
MHHHGPIAAVAAHHPYIATAGYDNQVILWGAATRQALARSLHDHLVNHCAFNSTGTLLASASSDYSVRLWEVPSMRLKAALIGHSDDVDMAVFSPDDNSVATCALDRTIRVFNLAGQCQTIFHGHTGNIISLAWTRDGKRLVSCSVDGTIREWDIASEKEVHCYDLSVRTDTLVIDADGVIFAGDDKGRIVTIAKGEMAMVQAHQAGNKKPRRKQRGIVACG